MVYPIIALWAHMRARSTAFLRMMIERGDVFVIHEPLVTLTDEGVTDVPDGRGGTSMVESASELFSHMRHLSKTRPVFFKDTVEHRYHHLFDCSDDVRDIVHTFIVRDPKPTISSAFHMKRDIVSPQIGYENLWDVFQLAREHTGKTPFLMNADQLVNHPEATVRSYCKAVGLDYKEDALNWAPGSQRVWEKTAAWHEDVTKSSGFSAKPNDYSETVDNNRLLAGFHRYHSIFYQRLIAHALA